MFASLASACRNRLPGRDKSDIRAIQGNDVAIKSYRSGKQPFPYGTVIARLAWSYIPFEANDKAFGRPQSFVCRAAHGLVLYFMVKDSKKYAATGGSGFAQVDENGIAVDDAADKPCFTCHVSAKADDYVFTHWCAVASQDRAIPPELEKAEATAIKAKSITVPSSHVVMLSSPKKLADFIESSGGKSASQIAATAR